MEMETFGFEPFLRITATRACNFRCVYCNPDGKFVKGQMSNDELVDVIKAGHELGVDTVHLTGGEPTIREGIVGIVEKSRKIGINKVSLTTNGYKFDDMAASFRDAGLTGASISLDSLRKDRVKALTGVDSLDKVVSAITKSCGWFPNVVVNMVVMKNNQDEVKDFVEFSRRMEGKFIYRACELQDAGPFFDKGKQFFEAQLVNKQGLIETLSALGQLESLSRPSVERDKENGHAEYFKYTQDGLTVGVIAPYSSGWPCSGVNCGRIRIGAMGEVRSCVAGKTYQLNETTYSEKISILQKILDEKKMRVQKNIFPDRHIPAYKELRFGISKNDKTQS